MEIIHIATHHLIKATVRGGRIQIHIVSAQVAGK